MELFVTADKIEALFKGHFLWFLRHFVSTFHHFHFSLSYSFQLCLCSVIAKCILVSNFPSLTNWTVFIKFKVYMASETFWCDNFSSGYWIVYVADKLQLELKQFAELEAFSQFAFELDKATENQLTRGSIYKICNLRDIQFRCCI